jgi:hypothetical protein
MSRQHVHALLNRLVALGIVERAPVGGYVSPQLPPLLAAEFGVDGVGLNIEVKFVIVPPLVRRIDHVRASNYMSGFT